MTLPVTVIFVNRRDCLFRTEGKLLNGRLIMAWSLQLTCVCGKTEVFQAPEDHEEPSLFILEAIKRSGWREIPKTGIRASGGMEGVCPKCGAIEGTAHA